MNACPNKVAKWCRRNRLGRSLQDLVGFLAELNAVGCDLYLERQAVDTTTPAGRALFGMLSVFSEFERAILVERVKAGMARVRLQGSKSGKPIGRPRISADTRARIVELLRTGTGIRATAREVGTGNETVARIKAAMIDVSAMQCGPLPLGRPYPRTYFPEP